MPEAFEPLEGMVVYFLGIISREPHWSAEETPELLALQEQHLTYIDMLTKEGKLVLTGPLLDDGEIRGIFVFKSDTLESAKELAQADPSVKAGRLIVNVHPWMIPQRILP